MLAAKNNVSAIRFEVLSKVAESFLKNNFADINDLPQILAGDKALRGSVAKDVQVLKEQIISVLGFTPENEDLNRSLTDFAQSALAR